MFGTDGEKALINAFQHEFPFAQHLTCFIHVCRNIKDELIQLGITQDIRIEILDDIFGKKIGDTHYEGIVDACTEVEFDEKAELLHDKWLLHENAKQEVQAFYEWFMKNKAPSDKKIHVTFNS